MKISLVSNVMAMVCLTAMFCLNTTIGIAGESPAKVSAKIDQLFDKSWAKAQVKPAAVAGDAVFLRRTYIDLTGVIPSIGEARSFINDTRPDKRSRLIDELLQRPNHSTHLANVWRDVMLPRGNNAIGISRATSFQTWLRAKFADNTPYDAMVREVLLASGSVNQAGPVLFYSALQLKPEELAASTSRIFLGVQIQCAQCHDHPFDHWTQEDFWGYAAFFAQLAQPRQRGNIRTVANVLDSKTGEVKLPNSNTVVPPQFLGSKQPVDSVNNTRRAELARWLTSKDNSFFPKATVNRAWALMFGRGLVDPVDDLGSHNPPSQPEVLELLARDFSENGFDLQRLFRVIANSKVYQRSSESGSENNPNPDTFAIMSVKSLTAEQIYDCFSVATCRREPIGASQRGRTNEKQMFIAKFDAPTQGATDFQAGIPQELTMLNGQLVTDATDLVKSDLLAALCDSPFFSDEERIETIFLATLYVSGL